MRLRALYPMRSNSPYTEGWPREMLSYRNQEGQGMRPVQSLREEVVLLSDAERMREEWPDNPCETHLNVKTGSDWCPICLTDERDRMREALEEGQGHIATALGFYRLNLHDGKETIPAERIEKRFYEGLDRLRRGLYGEDYEERLAALNPEQGK